MRFFFDVKEIETDFSLALGMDPCVLRKPIFLLIKIFVLVFQLDKCAAGGSLISSKGFYRRSSTASMLADAFLK
jgi:hypothetical protein